MPRSRAFVAAVAFATVLFALPWAGPSLWSTAAAEAPTPTLPAQAQPDEKSAELAKLFDAVVETIDQKFFDESKLKEVDWRARAAAVRPSVLAAATTNDAVRQINGLLSELKTSHTTLLTPDEYPYYFLLDIVGDGRSDLIARRYWGGGPYYPGTGAFTRETQGRHFVDGILEGSPADRAGLKYGDEILSVDRKPYSPITAFRGKIGMTVELEVRRDVEAEPQRLTVSVVPIRPIRAFSEATIASARVIERNGRRIGYVHVWASVDSDSLKSALAKLEPDPTSRERRRRAAANDNAETAKPLDFLIVDMRGRVGGIMSVAGQYLDLLDAKRPFWGNATFYSRSEHPSGRAPNAPFRGRSALLIDQNTRSAAEIMAHGFKRSAFGPVIGTPTAGAVSSGATYLMPGDLLLYVASGGLRFDGQPLESIGVAPDHRIERPLPYAAGADPVLDAALDLLAKPASQ